MEWQGLSCNFTNCLVRDTGKKPSEYHTRIMLGKIQYWAACPELYPEEAKRLGLDHFSVNSGDYLCIKIKNFRENMSDIGRAFKELIADSRIDPDGYCLEEYVDEHHVLCMVKCR